MKKFFSLLVLMLLPLVANSAVKIDGFLYDLDANTKTAKFTSGKNRTGETVIPSTVTYKDVVYSVTSIGDAAFKGCNLKNVYCYTELVPETKGNEEGPFYDSNENATLHVPASSVEAYSSALGWKDFENIVALTDSDPKPTGITSVNNNMVKSERYYSLDGKPLAAPQRGINIVKMSDGTTKKVVVK